MILWENVIPTHTNYWEIPHNFVIMHLEVYISIWLQFQVNWIFPSSIPSFALSLSLLLWVPCNLKKDEGSQFFVSLWEIYGRQTYWKNETATCYTFPRGVTWSTVLTGLYVSAVFFFFFFIICNVRYSSHNFLICFINAPIPRVPFVYQIHPLTNRCLLNFPLELETKQTFWSKRDTIKITCDSSNKKKWIVKIFYFFSTTGKAFWGHINVI